MGTKISDLPVTGVLPADAVFPLEYGGANYSVKASDLGTGGSAGGGYVENWTNSFGGVGVANGATFVIQHNLNSTDLITNAFVNSTATDTGAQSLGYYEVGTYNFGYAITDMTPNSVTITIGDDGYCDVNNTGGVTYTDIAGKYLKFIISAPTGGSSSSSSSGPGLGIEFFDTVEILADDLSGGNWSNATGAWVTVPSDPAWAGAENIIISMGLFDGDTAGNTGQAFEVRANSNSTSVEVLRHHGTSNDRSATAVQAIIPIDSDGTWQYRHVVLYGSYARIKYLRASGKILPIPSDNSWSSGWEQSHGGVAVANGSTHTITHNLGTRDIFVSAFVNSSASDVDADRLDGVINAPDGYSYGGYITSIIDENSFVYQLGDSGYGACNSSGSAIGTVFTDQYLRFVVMSGGGSSSSSSSGPRAYVAFDGTAGDLTASVTNSFNVASITDLGVGGYQVFFTNDIDNPIINATCCTISNGIGEISTNGDDPQIGLKSSIIVATNRNGGSADAAYIAITIF